MRRNDLYRLFVKWHFYLGLLVAPVLVIVAITGSLYVFKDEIESLLRSGLVFIEAEPNTEQIAPSLAIEVAAEEYPDYEITNLFTDRSLQRSWTLRADERGLAIDIY